MENNLDEYQTVSHIPTLREEQVRLTQQRILDTFENELMSNGYANVSIRSIARRAGMSVPTVYRYYANKEALLIAIMDASEAEVGFNPFSILAATQDPLEAVTKLLDGMWDALVAYEPVSQCHSALHDVALARFNDLSDARSYRLTSSRLRIPLALRLLLYWGAAIVIGSMYLFAVPSFTLHACMTAALGGAISHVLYVINDLDDCFGGDFQIPRTSFERLRRYLAEPVVAGTGSTGG